MAKSFPLVSATGMLGSGYREDSLDKAWSEMTKAGVRRIQSSEIGA